MCYNEFVSLATLSWGILKAYFHLVDCWNIFLESFCGHHYEKVKRDLNFTVMGVTPPVVGLQMSPWRDEL